jgi:hypothetical protein
VGPERQPHCLDSAQTAPTAFRQRPPPPCPHHDFAATIFRPPFPPPRRHHPPPHVALRGAHPRRSSSFLSSSFAHAPPLLLPLSPCAFAATVLMSCQRCSPPPPPQAAGHCVTRTPPPSLSEAILKPQLQLSSLRRPPQSKPKPPAFFHHGSLDVDCTSSTTPDPAATPLSSACAALHVPSAGAFDHRFIPLIVVPHRRPTLPRAVSSGETPSSRRHKSETPLPGLGPRPIPHQSTTTGWPEFAEDHRRRRRGKIPYSSLL